MISCAIVQGGVESGTLHYERVTSVGLLFFNAPPLVEQLENKAASEKLGASRGVLSGSCFGNAVLSSADEHDELVYTTAAAVHTRLPKQNASFNGHVFYCMSPCFSKTPRVQTVSLVKGITSVSTTLGSPQFEKRRSSHCRWRRYY